MCSGEYGLVPSTNHGVTFEWCDCAFLWIGGAIVCGSSPAPSFILALFYFESGVAGKCLEESNVNPNVLELWVKDWYLRAEPYSLPIRGSVTSGARLFSDQSIDIKRPGKWRKDFKFLLPCHLLTPP